MPLVIMLSVAIKFMMLSVAMLCVIMLHITMLGAVVLSLHHAECRAATT